MLCKVPNPIEWLSERVLFYVHDYNRNKREYGWERKKKRGNSLIDCYREVYTHHELVWDFLTSQ